MVVATSSTRSPSTQIAIMMPKHLLNIAFRKFLVQCLRCNSWFLGVGSCERASWLKRSTHNKCGEPRPCSILADAHVQLCELSDHLPLSSEASNQASCAAVCIRLVFRCTHHDIMNVLLQMCRCIRQHSAHAHQARVSNNISEFRWVCIHSHSLDLREQVANISGYAEDLRSKSPASIR
jgi:hypothetical protein